MLTSPAEAAKHGRQHIIFYMELTREVQSSNHFERCGLHIYKFYPKHHLFQHLYCEGIRNCGNPREIWCYGDEDNIGELVDFAEASNPAYVIRNVIDKDRL